MNVRQLRTFLPSKDLETSKQFYIDLGFPLRWEGEGLLILGGDNYNFFLQKYYQKEWAENLMMQLHVDDLDALYKVCEEVLPKYEGTKLKPIFKADYGRTFHILDPAGVLWHMTEYEVKEEDVEDHNKMMCEDKN